RNAHEGEEIFLAPDLQTYPLPRLKGFGNHGPRVSFDHSRGVLEDDDPVADAPEPFVPLRLADSLRLVVDESDLRDHPRLAEAGGALLTVRYERQSAPDRGDDLRSTHETTDRPGEFGPHSLREHEVALGKLSELGARTSRWHGGPSSSQSRTSRGPRQSRSLATPSRSGPRTAGTRPRPSRGGPSCRPSES